MDKPVIRKFEKRIVYSCFKDNIWYDDSVDTQLISKFNKEIRVVLCVIDIYSKYELAMHYQCFSENFRWVLSLTKQNMGK